MPIDKTSSSKGKKDMPTPPPGYQVAALPSFIRSANANTKLIPAAPKSLGGGKVVADVEYANPQTIMLREPSLFTRPVQTHESTHIYQLSRNPQFIEGVPSANSVISKLYDYGGIEGLEKALQNHKTIADFDLENQAQMVSDYQRLTAEAIKRGDRKALARVTAAYHPFIRQLSRIPAKGEDMSKMTESDLTPEAPGLPPATVPGMPMVPDKLLGGEIQYNSGKSSGIGRKVGERKTFANGKVGVWDGHGWKLQRQ